MPSRLLRRTWDLTNQERTEKKGGKKMPHEDLIGERRRLYDDKVRRYRLQTIGLTGGRETLRENRGKKGEKTTAGKKSGLEYFTTC